MQKKDVIAYFGSIAATARAIGLTHAAVSKWGETIPERRALRLEKMTGGQLKADPATPNQTE